MRVLLAEDEAALNRLITKQLKAEGYTVDSCLDGREAIDHLTVVDYDAVVLDITMPRADGFEVLAALRGMGKLTPVMFLSARDGVEDKVRGLDSGANDYLTKPFAVPELMARIRAMTRLSFGMGDNILTAGDLTMDCSVRSVRRAGREIFLSSREYALLEYLMRNRGIILSREKLEEHVWGLDYEGGTNVVAVYISYLREKIDSGHAPKLIHTVRGSGYVLRADP